MPNYDDYTDEYRRSARNTHERHAGMDRQQRLMMTISVGAALMLIVGVAIGFAIGRYTAPKPTVKVVTVEQTQTAGAIEEVPTETLEPAAPVVEATASVETTPPDNVAPDTPKQTAPANGAVLKTSRVTLRWSKVTDDSGVTYAFEIQNRLADGSWGKTQVIDKLDTNSYSARVLQVTRRWRVWAVDGAGNESEKSSWRTYKGVVPPPAKATTSTPSGNATQ
jgi:hypothetical protein